VLGTPAASAPFTGLAAPAVVGPPLPAGGGTLGGFLDPRSRGFSGFGLSREPSHQPPRLKPNGGKPRERGCGGGVGPGSPGVNAGPTTAGAASPMNGAEAAAVLANTLGGPHAHFFRAL
jgi:hypothetical protein